jgi:hypothetical protein
MNSSPSSITVVYFCEPGQVGGSLCALISYLYNGMIKIGFISGSLQELIKLVGGKDLRMLETCDHTHKLVFLLYFSLSFLMWRQE